MLKDNTIPKDKLDTLGVVMLPRHLGINVCIIYRIIDEKPIMLKTISGFDAKMLYDLLTSPEETTLNSKTSIDYLLN